MAEDSPKAEKPVSKPKSTPKTKAKPARYFAFGRPHYMLAYRDTSGRHMVQNVNRSKLIVEIKDEHLLEAVDHSAKNKPLENRPGTMENADIKEVAGPLPAEAAAMLRNVDGTINREAYRVAFAGLKRL